MSQGEFASFKDIVADILSNRKKDPLLHLLVLTYEFDDGQLKSLACGQQLDEDFEIRLRDLKILSDLRPIVIYDFRKTKESTALPQFLELHPFQSKAYACHHSKAYCFVTRKSVRLVIGSFNLTRTGLFENREVFEEFSWDSPESPNLNILREWLAFLEDYYLARLKESSLSTLTAIVATIRERIAAWPNPTNTPERRLLHSGYAPEETGLAALRKLWDSWYPGQEPDSLFTVSPFFDENPADRSLARDLKARFPKLRDTTIVTDAGVGGRMGKSHFGAAPAQADCRLLLIPEQLEESELKRIRLASSLSERKAKDLLIQRKLHAKILVLRSGNSGLAYMGSGNFSLKAWNGENRELGVVFKEPDAIRLEGRILKSLGVSGENHFSKLPSTAPPLPPEADLEGYREDSEFPGFIECIRLIPDVVGVSVRFEIESGSRHDPDARQLHQYQVEWGPTRLDFSSDFKSKWIDMKVFRQRIPGYRNLLFQSRNAPEKKYFFPFQYSGTLIEDRETFILPTSLDWMAFYLNPDADYRYSDFERIPGEEQTNIRRPDLLDVDRAGNTVIAMQAYLNLFAKVEDDFLRRIASVGDLEPDQREAMVKRDFVEPLRSYGRILEQEAAAWKENGPDSLFKMGEFLGLVRHLCQSTTSDVRPHFDPILEHAERCIGLWKGNQPLRKEYAAFVTGIRND